MLDIRARLPEPRFTWVWCEDRKQRVAVVVCLECEWRENCEDKEKDETVEP